MLICNEAPICLNKKCLNVNALSLKMIFVFRSVDLWAWWACWAWWAWAAALSLRGRGGGGRGDGRGYLVTGSSRGRRGKGSFTCKRPVFLYLKKVKAALPMLCDICPT